MWPPRPPFEKRLRDAVEESFGQICTQGEFMRRWRPEDHPPTAWAVSPDQPVQVPESPVALAFQ